VERDPGVTEPWATYTHWLLNIPTQEAVMPRRTTRNRSELPQSEGIGPPPAGWNQQGVDLWREMQLAAPWLTRADRMLAEHACRSVAAARQKWTVSALRQESRALAAIGLDVRRRLRAERPKGGR